MQEDIVRFITEAQTTHARLITSVVAFAFDLE